VGKLSFDADKLQANAQALIDAVIKAKPSASKGRYVERVTVCSTMSPSLEVDAGDTVS
jgi:large subunit ribosomal protein L1